MSARVILAGTALSERTRVIFNGHTLILPLETQHLDATINALLRLYQGSIKVILRLLAGASCCLGWTKAFISFYHRDNFRSFVKFLVLDVQYQVQLFAKVKLVLLALY